MTVEQDAYNFTNALSRGSSPTIYAWDGSADLPLPRACRYIRAEGAGNVVYKDANGDTKTAAFKAGETRALIVTAFVDSGTTATGVEAMV